MNSIVIFSIIGLISGLVLSVGGLLWSRRRQRRALEKQAEEFVLKAEEVASQIEEDAQHAVQQFEEEAWTAVEAELLRAEERVAALELELKEKEEDIEEKIEAQNEVLKKQLSLVQSHEDKFKNREARHNDLKAQFESLKQKWVNKLLPIAQVQTESLKAEIQESYLKLIRREVELEKQEKEQEVLQNLEREARRVLTLVINRFARPYCPERGIGNVEFPNPDVMQRVLGKDRENITHVEKTCGVDITVNEEYMSVSVLGFDPVRRELGRASLEKLIHERNVTEKRIEEIVAKTKRDLFKRIRQDGDKITRELGLRDMHPEVRNMMGTLRYRYSFAQNQYFHCAEVGWLCGLLSSELGLPILTGRRAGMLHDIGKAMDHSREGGHAVIGADFIEKHNESPEVVHAVRAHHFDETPSTDVAYLVIAADAISGARPGARRSTVDSYTQKMASLEKIGNSFDGVTSTFVLSAGREVRLIVDSQKLDDLEALELSKKVAQKIEEECSYPGLIRVTVVREIQSVDHAR